MKKLFMTLLAAGMIFSFYSKAAFAAETPLQAMVHPLLGTPYVWGGLSPKGFDCSGFTKYIFAKIGVKLPHNSAMQSKKGKRVSRKQLRAGDLVFFHTYGKGITHVGLYLGEGKFADATDKGLMINRLDSRYFNQRYVTATRILDDKQYKQITGLLADSIHEASAASHAPSGSSNRSTSHSTAGSVIKNSNGTLIKWIVTDSVTNVREHPDLQAAVKFQAKPEAIYPVLAVKHTVSGDWDEIIYKGQHTAWIADWVVHKQTNVDKIAASRKK